MESIWWPEEQWWEKKAIPLGFVSLSLRQAATLLGGVLVGLVVSAAFNFPLAVLLGKDAKPARVLTGGLANFGAAAGQKGQITVRDLTGGKQHGFEFPPVRGTQFLPRAAVQAGNAVAPLSSGR